MPRLSSFSRLSLIVLLLAALGSVAWAKPKVAILGLEAANAGVVDPKDAANAGKLTEELRAIPRGNVGKYELAANSNRELQDEKLMGNCDTEKPVCMAPIGAGLGADYLIYGKIEKGTDKNKVDGYKAELKILNVKTGKIEETSGSFVPMSALGGGTGAKEWAQKVYAKLTGEKPPVTPDVTPPPKAGPGKLIVNGNVKSGDVLIGGSKKGRLEDGTLTLSLPEGSYDLAIEAPSHKRYEATVTVKSGQTRTVDAELEQILGETVSPPIGGEKKSNRMALKATGYGLAGLGVASAAYVLYLTVSGPIPDYEGGKKGVPVTRDPVTMMDKQIADAGSASCSDTTLRNYTPDPVRDPNPNRAFDEACKANKRRFIAGAVGIASGVLAAGALYFAYRSEGRAMEKPTAMGKRKRRELTVTPVISPEGGGATVRFDW
jgi:hypothetical protein